MKKSVIINKQPLSVRNYKGQNVVTFKDIDLVHGRPEGTARKRFNDNRKHFIEGIDYFKIQPSENRTVGITSPNGGIVITESGYLMLAKSFTDDLAWQVQRELVNVYFRSNNKALPKKERLTIETEEYHYFDKTYKGEPVITLADFEHITGIEVSTVRCRVKGVCKQGVDYLILNGTELIAFKIENPNVKRSIKSIFLLKKTAVEKLLKWFKSGAEIPKCFIVTKKEAPKTQRRYKEPCGDDFITTLNTLAYLKQFAEEVYASHQSETSKKNIDSANNLMKFCGLFMSTNVFEK